MRFAPRCCLIFLLLLGATACRERIQHGLDERQANELQAVLIERGLDARKMPESGKKPTWSIEVRDEQSSDAVRILAELGLPRPAEEVGCDVFGGGGLVRTPVEEGVCRVRVMERGLEKTLQTVDGVLLARVHLVVPAPPRPGQVPGPSKASAMLRVAPGNATRVRQASETLRTLIAGGVEGLAPESVSLLVDEVSSRVEVPTGGGHVAADEASCAARGTGRGGDGAGGGAGAGDVADASLPGPGLGAVLTPCTRAAGADAGAGAQGGVRGQGRATPWTRHVWAGPPGRRGSPPHLRGERRRRLQSGLFRPCPFRWSATRWWPGCSDGRARRSC